MGTEVDLRHRLHGLAALGSLAYWLGDATVMTDAYPRRFELAEESGDLSEIAEAHFDLAFAHASRFDLPGVEREWRAAHEAYASVSDRLGMACCEWIELGMLAFQRGERMNSDQLVNRLLPIFRQEGDVLYMGLVSGALAWDAMARGDVAAARRWGKESLTTYQTAGDVSSAVVTLEGMALLLRASDKPGAGAQVEGAAQALSQTYGLRTPPGLAGQLEQARRGVALATLDAASEERYRAQGRRMTLDDAIAVFMREV